jgi:hypothetical protein
MLATSPIAHIVLTRLEEKLLEEPAQLERRALAAVRHQGRCDVARAIDLPVANGGASRSRIPPRAGRAAFSLLTSGPALAEWRAGDGPPERGLITALGPWEPTMSILLFWLGIGAAQIGRWVEAH